jgi:hypothetical protein
MAHIDQTILKRMEAMQWSWADKDPRAAQELTQRIISAGQRRKLVPYSELVEGVLFEIPSIHQGRPYTIDTSEWEGLDRALLGEFLGLISTESYRAGGFYATAIVIGKSQNMPSEHFFDWMEWLGVLPDTKQDTVLRFWAEQVVLAHGYYKHHDHH